MAGKLKPLDIPREEKPGKYADGDGLYLIGAIGIGTKASSAGMALAHSKTFR